jgi:hypothetical protein
MRKLSEITTGDRQSWLSNRQPRSDNWKMNGQDEEQRATQPSARITAKRGSSSGPLFEDRPVRRTNLCGDGAVTFADCRHYLQWPARRATRCPVCNSRSTCCPMAALPGAAAWH